MSDTQKQPRKESDAASAEPVLSKEQAQQLAHLKSAQARRKKAEEEILEGSKGNEFNEILRTAMWAVAFALVIRTLFFEPFNIPSGSMKPTLLIGDYIFVSKPSYGYSRYSFPFSPAFIKGRVWGDKLPQRGDVAVFRLPSNPSIDYIKRVVALPGERVQMIEGRLYINGVRTEREFIRRETDIEHGGVHVEMLLYRETLPGGTTHMIYEEGDNGPLDNTAEFVVPEGHYFAMGDNRDNSQDSRVTTHVGSIPLENMIGRATRIFFSTDGTASLIEFWKWPFSTRFSRLFDKIEADTTP